MWTRQGQQIKRVITNKQAEANVSLQCFERIYAYLKKHASGEEI